MPAPIPITRTSQALDSFGSPRFGGLTPRQSSILAGGASYKEQMAVSLGKDVSEIMDYSIARFSTSIDSDITVAPSSVKLESTFCRNFTCCGQKLDDLHDLLQHYEECHVRFEDEMPAMVTDDDMESSGSSSASTSQPPSPRTSNATTSLADFKKKSAVPTSDNLENTSAFDTAVMRSPSMSKVTKKRSFGQYTNPGSNSTVHQSLRRALIDGGVGRRTPGQPNIYSPNSPFSTPGSSIPGTPSPDTENDTFFSNGLSPSAFSALSIRSNGSDEHHLPSCAPPNLFFPASGSSASSGQPPAKRERMSSCSSTASAIAIENALRAGAAAIDKPFKCLAPGCDKAYKQMNGLKYHRLHGACNQNNLPIHTQAAAPPPTVLICPPRPAEPLSSPTSPIASTSPVAFTPAELSPAAIHSLTISTVEPFESELYDVSTPPSTPPSPTLSIAEASSPSPSSPASSGPAIPLGDRLYICQVGACGKRYKNLNGLRYHYLHSGSHGLLGLQLLQTAGGSSAKVDASGRAPVSTNTLSSEEIAAAAQAAQLAQEQIKAAAVKSAAATASSAAAASMAAAAARNAEQQQTLYQNSFPSLPQQPQLQQMAM